MKKISAILVILSVSMGLMSCSSEEILTPEETGKNLLEEFTIKRNSDGSYYVDYTLANNAEASLSTDKKTNSKDFYLYSSDNQSKRNFNEALALQDNALRVGFTDTESGKQPFITVEDDDIKFGKRNADEEFLTEYSVTMNEDGTVDLAFTVEDNVAVNFIQNQEGVYEIHLEDGTNVERDYSRTFVKEDGVDLKIDFINHSNEARKEANNDSASSSYRRPRIVISYDSEI